MNESNIGKQVLQYKQKVGVAEDENTILRDQVGFYPFLSTPPLPRVLLFFAVHYGDGKVMQTFYRSNLSS